MVLIWLPKEGEWGGGKGHINQTQQIHQTKTKKLRSKQIAVFRSVIRTRNTKQELKQDKGVSNTSFSKLTVYRTKGLSRTFQRSCCESLADHPTVIWHSLCFYFSLQDKEKQCQIPTISRFKQRRVVAVMNWGLHSVCSDSFASGHPALLLLARCAAAWRPLISTSVQKKAWNPCWGLGVIKPGWESFQRDVSLSSASEANRSESNKCRFLYSCLRSISSFTLSRSVRPPFFLDLESRPEALTRLPAYPSSPTPISWDMLCSKDQPSSVSANHRLPAGR